MTTVIPRPTRRKAQRAYRIGAATVYRSKAARKPDPVWRAVVAGAVFLICAMACIVCLLGVGLLIFG